MCRDTLHERVCIFFESEDRIFFVTKMELLQKKWRDWSAFFISHTHDHRQYRFVGNNVEGNTQFDPIIHVEQRHTHTSWHSVFVLPWGQDHPVGASSTSTEHGRFFGRDSGLLMKPTDARCPTEKSMIPHGVNTTPQAASCARIWWRNHVKSRWCVLGSFQEAHFDGELTDPESMSGKITSDFSGGERRVKQCLIPRKWVGKLCWRPPVSLAKEQMHVS